MQKLDAVDAASLRDDIPSFRAGDTLKVHVKVIEGNLSRIQVFQGVVTKGDVRRAKLYYLRERHGKAAKIKEHRSGKAE